jgi:Protein of unknown function (DUF2778)
MSTSTVACYNFAAPTLRKPARQSASQRLLAAAAIGGLVFGSSWTIYANIFAASPYPQLGSSNFDTPVVRRPADVVARSFARLDPPLTVVPETMPAEPQLSFLDRFAAAAPQGVAPAPVPEPTKLAVAPKPEPLKLAEAPKAKETPKESKEAKFQLAAVSPAAQPQDPPKTTSKIREMAQRAKDAILSIASSEKQSMMEKLWGKGPARNPVLAYASADASATANVDVTGSVAREQNPMLGGSAPYDRDTAVYDITAHTVYLPDGTKLEAHSGLGSSLDDPRSQRTRMRGVTPPHIYTLKPREALFHGVAALRLTPIGGEEAIFGREGLLAHTFMLGPSGDSNGCVSFRDYNAFLSAYHNMGIRKLAVVARVE